MLSRRMFFTILRSTSWVMVTYSWISEIDQFFKAKNKPLRELSNPLLLADLAFLVDLHDHLNTLNKRLPGKDPHSPLALITLTVLTTTSITSPYWIVFASWWMIQWNSKASKTYLLPISILEQKIMKTKKIQEHTLRKKQQRKKVYQKKNNPEIQWKCKKMKKSNYVVWPFWILAFQWLRILGALTMSTPISQSERCCSNGFSFQKWIRARVNSPFR